MVETSRWDMSKPFDRRQAYTNRFRKLETERSGWDDTWRKLKTYLHPQAARFEAQNRDRGNQIDYIEILDNTASSAMDILTAGMFTGTSNPARPWFTLTTDDPDLAEFYPVRVWLDEVASRMRQVFAKSNTYRVLPQLYSQLICYGTAANVVRPHFDRIIHHYPVATGRFAVQTNHEGEVVTFYRHMEKTVSEVVAEFGIDNCSTSVRTRAHNGDLESTVEILHVIEPRQDRQFGKRDNKNMPWRSAYLELYGNEDRFLRESGFERFPVLVPRWRVEGDDVYGVCPGMRALGDIQQLQQQQLRKGQAIDYQTRPPLQIPTSLMGRKPSIEPGGASYLDPGTAWPFDQSQPHGGIRTAFEVQLDLGLLLQDIQDVRERIISAFHADLFMMMARAGTETHMTAYEVSVRESEKLMALGPVLERVHNELLHPMIDLTFQIMVEAGIVPTPPQELQGAPLGVEFVSILAQAQKAIGGNSMDRFIGSIIQVGSAVPQVFDKINWDGWVEGSADLHGIDSEVILPQEEVDALRQARAQSQAAEAQIAAMREQAATAKDLAQAPVHGQNALGQVLGAGVPAGVGG